VAISADVGYTFPSELKPATQGGIRRISVRGANADLLVTGDGHMSKSIKTSAYRGYHIKIEPEADRWLVRAISHLYGSSSLVPSPFPFGDYTTAERYTKLQIDHEFDHQNDD
jgi:hypothetical protein